jgi:hypothetical protein
MNYDYEFVCFEFLMCGIFQRVNGCEVLVHLCYETPDDAETYVEAFNARLYVFTMCICSCY